MLYVQIMVLINSLIQDVLGDEDFAISLFANSER